MKGPFTTKTLQPGYVFRFRIHNHNFTCKLISEDKGLGLFLGVPYISYRVTVFSPTLKTFEIPYLISYPYNFNYRTFRSAVQREVTSYVSCILFN